MKPALLLWLLLLSLPLSAQPSRTIPIGGVVRDSVTGEPLRFATVRIEGTTKGSITRADGTFLLRLEAGSYTLAFSMVGYRAVRRSVTLTADSVFIEVLLADAPFKVPELVVSAEDPGVGIMRRALRRKDRQVDSLGTYSYRLYTRFVVSTDTLTAGRSSGRSDTTIFSIFESYSDGYYRKPDDYYNEIIQRRQTANVPPEANFVAFGTNLNAYDDQITILGEEIATPFNPDALDYYDFVLERVTEEDEGVEISRIRVEPNSNGRKLFSGYVGIDAARSVPVYVELKPNRAVALPFDADLTYNQKFTLSDGFVLPSGMSILSSLQASIFWIIAPRLDIEIQTVSYDYRCNIPLDDDLFSRRRVEAAPSADEFDSTYWNRNVVMPLRPEELAAYDQIRTAIENPDSLEGTSLVDKIFGEIPRIIGKLNRKPFTGLDDIFRYNRVHGAYLGAGLTGEIVPGLEATIRGGYGTADGRGYGEIALTGFLDSNRHYSLFGSGYRRLARRDNPLIVTARGITLLSLLWGNDYGDYYYSDGFELGAEAGFGQLKFIRRDIFVRPTTLRIYLRSEHQATALSHQTFALFGGDAPRRENPGIIDGTFRSVGFELNLNYSPLRTISDFGVRLTGEFSDPTLIPSDFRFQQYTGTIVWRTRTLPLWELDLRLSGGFSYGEVPPQRFFSLESAASAIAGEAVFRGMEVKEFYGDRFASVSMEHNFGEIIPGVLRIPNVAAFGIEFILLGRLGWTAFSQQTLAHTATLLPSTDSTGDRYYYEAGIGFNRVLLFFRVDLSARLSQVERPKLFLTISGATF